MGRLEDWRHRHAAGGTSCRWGVVGVQSGAAVPPQQELKRFRHPARPGSDPRAESGRAGGITSPICIQKKKKTSTGFHGSWL